MVRMAFLLLAAVLLLGGCAGSMGDQSRRDTIRQTSTCAMCGASVSPGYFDYSTERTWGPSRGW